MSSASRVVRANASAVRRRAKSSVARTIKAPRVRYVPSEHVGGANYRYSNDGRVYRIAAAALVERPAVVNAPMPEWEAAYEELRWRREQETVRGAGQPVLDAAARIGESKSAAKSKAKLKAKKPAGGGKAAAAKRDAKDDAAADADEEEYDPTVEELALFEPAPRITAADRAGDRTTVDRRLDTSLFLVVHKPRTENAWQLPQGSLEHEVDGALLRSVAERELREECGESLRVFFYGNSPLFRLQYLHDAEAKERLGGADGTQLFVFPALYLGGDVTLERAELDAHEWLAHDELHARLDASLASQIVSLTTDGLLSNTGAEDVRELLAREEAERAANQ